MPAPDHLVVAAASLAEGTAWLEERLGVRAQPGGVHAAMGTHNALASLGSRLYLEVIAVDPSAPGPARPRWFDLDEPGMRARLSEGPSLVHWVARSDDFDRDAARAAIGIPIQVSRGDFAWRITVPADGHLPWQGLVPTLIGWGDSRHPSDTLPVTGIRLLALAGEHPDPASVRAKLAAMGLSGVLSVTYARSPRLAAMLQTPRGVVTL